jgi:hypothetical protein
MPRKTLVIFKTPSYRIVFAILCFAIIDGRFKKPGVFILQQQSPENEDERLKSQVRNAERV